MPVGSPTIPVPPLVGTLPPDCKRDLEAMQRFVHACLKQEAPDPPVPVSACREVFLTGATGFIGRFLLRDLLVQDETRRVHCLVRAHGRAQGFARVRAAMQQACIWEEDFTHRIRVVVGDMAEDRFGLSEADFAGLCQQIEAVYHVAADVALAAPYARVREAALGGLRQVLALCLTHRFKHLFFTSSLGVFPQYFCDFRNEFAQSRITVQMQPDLNTMKQMYPLGLSGYPWSKLVAEQALLYAQRAGMPLAIFRLPLSGSSTTGFPNAAGFLPHLFGAMVAVEARLRGGRFMWDTEPADVHSRIIAAIAVNPHRRYTIYHCVNPRPLYHGIGSTEFGFNMREVSLATFKRLCRAREPEALDEGYWPLIDYFAPYWLNGTEPGEVQLVDTRAMREDCPVPIQWPGVMTLLRRMHGWIADHRDAWPHPVPEGLLDFDRLVAQSAAYAEAEGIAHEEALPAWMQEGLWQLVQALQAPEARLQGSTRDGIILELNLKLRANAYLAGDRARYPEMASTEVVRPVFIVGINRTGTTLLHRLMAQDRRFRALRSFEMAAFAPVRDAFDNTWGTPEDPRYDLFDDMMEASGVTRALVGLHRIDPNDPEEDLMLMGTSFHSWPIPVRYHVPAYAQWLQHANMCPPYEHHRRMLQHFAYVDRLPQASAGQWLLKMPFHLMELEALIHTYPDALFIQTHRAPHQFMGSWISLAESIRPPLLDPRPRHELGAEQLALMVRLMDRAIDFRLAHPELEHRWLDLSYYDLVQDSLAMVKIVYDHFHWHLAPEVEVTMDNWLFEQSRLRQSEPSHQYDLADYGLSPGAINEAFGRYRKFTVDRGLNQSRL